MAGFTELFDYSAKQNRKIEKVLAEIKEKQKEFENVSLDQFQNHTKHLKERLKKGETLEDILVDAYALIAEAFKKLQQKNFKEEDRKGYYDEQIKTSIALSNGDLVQMLTGEGKTYALTLSAYLSALKEEGVHILTSNEYLAKRDYEENRELFETMGLKASFVAGQDTKEEKRKGYACDITYATPETVAFDYLQDNMAITKEDQVMRKLSTCILDEVDSSLIDEATTPFIISENDNEEKKEHIYKDINNIVASLKGKTVTASLQTIYKDDIEMEKDTAYLDFIGSQEDSTIFLTEVGIERVNRKLKQLGYKDKIETVDGKKVVVEPYASMSHFINNALIAQNLMKNKEDYLVQDGKVKVINKQTGRIVPKSSFNKGLQQALEAKENVDIKEDAILLNSINQPNFFKLYSSFSGLSGTLLSAKKELKEIYHKEVVAIKPRKGMHRVDEETIIYQTEKEKYDEILKEVKIAKEKGQPILIGTETIEQSERVSNFLKENNIENRLLNASSLDEEADIIQKAGEVGAITVATNIAGRGTDIKVNEEALKNGGLYIIGSNLSESKRIDDQLRGRSGRQGNIGKSKFIISLEDTIFRKRYIPEKLTKIKKFLKSKTPKEVRHFIQKFQQSIEIDAFVERKRRNELENIDAFFREHFDKENEQIRNAENLDTIFLSILEEKVKEDKKKDSFLDKYKRFDEHKSPEVLSEIIQKTVEKKLREEKQRLGKDALNYQLKKLILNTSRKVWTDFMAGKGNRQIQAGLNSTYTGTDKAQEYFLISEENWTIEMNRLKDNIIENVIEHFGIKKEVSKEETTKITKEDIINEIASMFFHKDQPQKIKELENMLEKNKQNISKMDKQLIESSILVSKKAYKKKIKEALIHVNAKEQLEQIEQNIYYEIMTEEEKILFQNLIEEVKNNLKEKVVSANTL